MRFSIIIPTRNRPDRLDACLTAIEALHFPRNGFEVLVVDDGSETPLDEVIRRHERLVPLRYQRTTGIGPARARNCGLRQARGQFVVFTDDDCMPRPHWLTAYARAFDRCPNACLGGPIVSSPCDGIFGAASQALITFLYGNAGGSGASGFFCSNNLALPREALAGIGGFDETFPLAAAEDRDLCARWAAQGELRFVPDAVVDHRQNLTARSFCSQHYRYGRGAFRFWEQRRAEGHSGRRLESTDFYRRMLLSPFSEAHFPRALAMSALIALSQACCAAGYFRERGKRG